MSKTNFLWIIMICLIIPLLGCQTDEQRIRNIVKDEIASAVKRTTITDANVIGPYSPAQKVGNFIFVSGQIALNQETGLLDNKDIETETKKVLENLMLILRKTGCDSSDVLSTNVYLTDINDYTKMNNIYGGYFQEGNYPARVTVQVKALPKNARVEISAIAYKSK